MRSRQPCKRRAELFINTGQLSLQMARPLKERRSVLGHLVCMPLEDRKRISGRITVD